MEQATRRIVQDTWTQVAADQISAANLFYSRLFELDPSIQYLFKGDLDDQKMRLMGMFNVAVRGLDKLEEMIPMLEDLGKRHVSYSVLEEHYSTMGEALLYMIEQRLGEAFNDEVDAAWRETYGRWASAMVGGASNG
jgi:hemoglobin-like flavoprotein